MVGTVPGQGPGAEYPRRRQRRLCPMSGHATAMREWTPGKDTVSRAGRQRDPVPIVITDNFQSI